MRVVHVVSGLTKGGGERVVVELANKAAAKGDDITIIAGWKVDSHFLQDTIDENIDVKFITKTKWTSYFNIIPWIFQNKNWLKTNDVIHCHLTFGAVFGTLVCLLLRKRPYIVETYHAVGMKIPRFNRFIHRLMIKTRDGIVFMAKDAYWDNFIAKNPRLKNKLIPNGIALLHLNNSNDSKKEFLNENNISESVKYLVGSVSMLRPDRRPTYYIPVAEMLKKEFGSDVNFILGGEGVERQKLEMMIKESKLENIFHLLGLISTPADIITKLDIYVSISVGKTTGLSMIEAAMCKVPVLGIQLLDDYEAKKDDWVWSHQDLNEIANKIIYLLKNEDKRKELANKQYQYVVEHFSSDAMYSSYIKFYNTLISG